MFDRAIAYHREKIRHWTHVLEADGNHYSAEVRKTAQVKIADHTAILNSLLPPPASSAGIAVAVLRGEAIINRHRAERLTAACAEESLVTRGELEQSIAACTKHAEACEAGMRLLTEAVERPLRRHKKRGGTYIEYGRGKLQTDVPLGDNAPLVGYRDAATGDWWFRSPSEMDDGRFEDVPGEPR